MYVRNDQLGFSEALDYVAIGVIPMYGAPPVGAEIPIGGIIFTVTGATDKEGFMIAVRESDPEHADDWGSCPAPHYATVTVKEGSIPRESIH